MLLAFELAEREAADSKGNDEKGQVELNFVVVGGGPTGVELAGTLAEISHQVLTNEFHSIDPKELASRCLKAGRASACLS